MKKLGVMLMLLLPAVYMPGQTTEGTEFWVTFMNNYDVTAGSSGLENKLIASSRENATVTVSNPQTGYSQSFNVKAGAVAEFTVPPQQGYTYNKATVENKGLRVTSTAPISLYASNFYEYTYDATIVVPITGLGQDYIVQIYENEISAKEMCVVATENGTQVTVTPHARTADGHVKNVPYSVTLNAGQTYQVMSGDGGSDFSGTRVQTNKPVAVFAGHQCINVPTGNAWCDHIVEQQMPVPMWGRQFALTKTYGQNGDMVMVTAKEDNTQVKMNGSVVATLNALQSCEFRLTENSAFVETSAPAACFLYIEGAQRNNMTGDPSSVHISPVEQQVGALTFATFQTSVSRTHYVNIVTTAAGAQKMTLDGKSISSSFTTLAGNSKYRFAQINISHGTHTLQTTADGFTGHVYGLGYCESYAYTMGSSTIPLDGDIMVNGEPRADIEYEDKRCYKETITFSPCATSEISQIWWNFGDGTESTEKTVTHTYDNPGTYRVRMVVANKDGRDTAYTNLTVVSTLHSSVSAAICKGEKYQIAGETFTVTGDYDIALQSYSGCDSIVTLHLDVGETYLRKEEGSFRRGSSYRWHWKWYKKGGVYYDTLQTVNGCDSVFELTLTEVEETSEMYDTICYQPSYEFKGHKFALPDVAGREGQKYIDYVLEYRDKEACANFLMNLAIVPEAGGAVEKYDTIQEGQTYSFYGDELYKEGTYYKTVSNVYGCEQEITFHLAVLSFPINVTEAALCTSDAYTFRGKTYTEPGMYSDTVLTDRGIEAIYRLILTDNRKLTTENIQTTGSYSWPANGKTYTESGTYTAKLVSESGCDSIVTLNLGIGEKCKIEKEIERSVCDGESFSWDGTTCSAGNTYTKTYTSAGGCDSVVTLTVKALAKPLTTLNVSICKGDFYKVGTERLSDEGPHTVTLTAQNGCDSVVTVNIKYNEPFVNTTDATITSGGSYNWEGETYTETGVYKRGFVAQQNGCDSICVLNLQVVEKPTVNRDVKVELCYGETYNFYGETLTATTTQSLTTLRSGEEADTLVTLTMTVLPSYPDLHEYHTMCEGETYEWNGETYTKSEERTLHLKTALDCDSTVTLHLTVHPSYKTKDEDVTMCEGETYMWNDTPYTKSDTYTQSFRTIHDCDSTVTRTITFNPESSSHTLQSIFTGETFSWNGKEYDKTGDYEYHTDNFYGCDSTAYLHLTVSDKAVVSRVETVTLCEGEKYAFYGETLTAVATNTYTHRLSGEEADTLVTLTMTVLPVKRTTLESVTLCEGETFTWNGTPYTTSGTYTQTFTASNDCDSIVTQTLFYAPVYDNVKDHKHVYTGMTYTWQGETYSESTEVTKTLHTFHGCDSVVTLILTVSDKPLETREVNAVICEGETYNFYGEVFASATDYTVTREGEEADTLVTLHLSVLTRYEGIEFEDYMCEGREYVWNDESFVAAGDYTRTLKSTAGCDSVVTLHLNTYPRYDLITIDDTITDGMSYTWDGRTYTASGNYPYTYQTINGCDSIVTLRLYNNKIEVSRVEIAEQCAGEGALEVVVEMSGVAHQVRLLFDEKAHEAGLRDTSVAVISGMATVPYNARAGRFGCEVQLLFRGGVAFSRYEPVVLLYPSSVLEQAWNDVVAVLTHDYNGGYDFVSFYWYEDGQALIGETGSYLYRPLKMGSEYSALLTDVTGLQMMTCPLVATEQTDISLYPTFVQRRGRTRCHVTDDAMLYIYDSTGSCCYSAAVSQGDTVIEMPEVSGIYMVRIVTRKANKVKTYKMMVE
ncbi:MAG: PKD domain-containing protein [Paludibacteraceae bacterium]|nr:PKD domain-containing protein [Paludibacteraceae bacterium]